VCRPGCVSFARRHGRCAYIRDGAVERRLGRRALCSEEAVHGAVDVTAVEAVVRVVSRGNWYW
jgi:hypothetical protein